MGIDARIPLGVTPIDPNGFTNALAAGMKMRELRNASDSLARKEEKAIADSTSLSNYLSNPQTPEGDQAFARANPEGFLKTRKVLSDADNNAAQAKIHNLTLDRGKADVMLKRLDLAARLLGGVTDQPTYERAVADANAASLDTKHWPTKYFADWVSNQRNMALSTIEQENLKLKSEPKQHYNSFTDSFVTQPTTGGQEAPVDGPQAGPEPAAVEPRRPVMEPGQSSGSTTDEIRAEIARLKQGGTPSPHFFGKSKDPIGSLEMLLQAQTDLENGQGGATTLPADVPVPPAAPVDGEPAPVQPAPVPPAPVAPPPVDGQQKPAARSLPTWDSPPRNRAEAEWRRGQVEAAKYELEQGSNVPKVYKTPTGQKTLIDPQNPDLGFNPPIPGSAKPGADGPLGHLNQSDAKDYKKIAVEQGRFEDALKMYRALITNSGTTAVPGPLQAQLDNAYQAVQDQARILSGMGAPQAGEMLLLTKRLVPPTEFFRNIADGAGIYDLTASINAQLDQTEVLLNQGKATVNEIYLRGKIMEPTAPGGADTAKPQPDTSPAPSTPVKIAPVEDLADMPLPGGKYTGQWAKDPSSGIVYRSDGKNWNKWTPPVKRPEPAKPARQ